MQVNNVMYLDLEIEGYEGKNLISYSDIYDFQIIETAGASLAIVYMSFVTNNYDLANSIISNNMVKVKCGTTEEDCDTFSVYLYKPLPPKNDPSGSGWLVEFSGFTANKEYMINQASEAYWGNSLLVTQRVLYDMLGVKPGNGLNTNIYRTNENQVCWRRTNQTACCFVAETLVHMDIMPSFPLFAFDKYGNFHLRDFVTTVKEGAKYTFVSRPPQSNNEIQYVDSFSVEDFRDTYNLYSGYNKVTEIYGAKTGISGYVISENEPILASTHEADKSEGNSRVSSNKIQSANVHNTYVAAYTYNTNKLVALSSMLGCLQVKGRYIKDLKPTDIINVKTDDSDTVLDGSYIVDTIRYRVCPIEGTVTTYVYVTRDNKNNIENYVANPRKGLKIRKQWLTDVMNAVSQLRVAYALGQQIVDGRYMRKMLAFGIETKRNLLRSFNIAGVPIDFNSSANLIQSLICSGNSLMNSLLSMIFPEQIAGVFRDFIIRKPTLRALLGRYIAAYVPYELIGIITAIVDSLFKTTDSLNSIARDNGIKVTAGTTTGSAAATTDSTTANIGGDDTVIDDNTSEIDYTSDNQEKVKDIITDFENNTSGLNIPFPIIDLSESQSLMSDIELRNYVANQTIANLTNLGYMDGVDLEEFKNILLGVTPIDFNVIDKINRNAGDTYNYRFWGTFNDLTELTEFVIKKSYKDKFRTIPCTKIVSAARNAKIFFACPANEDDLRFYVNSKRIEVIDNLDEKEDEYRGKSVIGYFPINLGYTDVYGNQITYNVYYTNTGYNSTGVLFEVKQGGMV